MKALKIAESIGNVILGVGIFGLFVVEAMKYLDERRRRIRFRKSGIIHEYDDMDWDFPDEGELFP